MTRADSGEARLPKVTALVILVKNIFLNLFLSVLFFPHMQLQFISAAQEVADVVALPEMLLCLLARDMEYLIQRSLRNQTLWQERFTDSSDDTLISSEEQQREDTR